MRRVDNFLRTTHWIAESAIYTMDRWGLNSDCYIRQKFDLELGIARSLDEWSLGNDFMWWVQYWIDRIDTEIVRVPCNGGVF